MSVNRDCIVQTTNLGAASNERFVEMLAAQTMRAMSTGSLLAKKPEIDLMLRLAETSQISEAIGRSGVKSGEPFLLIVAGRSRVKEPGKNDGTELPRRKLTGEELLRIEKAALLNARRS